MDEDRMAGSAKPVKGALEQVAGKAVGDAQLESEGKTDKVDGSEGRIMTDLPEAQLAGVRLRLWSG
jgi:hypothetical protein